MDTYHILIADDSDAARKAVRMLLNEESKFQVVAEATDGREAVEMAKHWMPDLLLMDINMPFLNGLEATKVIRRELPYIKVVMLSVSDDAKNLFEAIRCGAQGYLVKSMNPTDWISYLHAILDGDTPISLSMAEKILMEFKPVNEPAPVSEEFQKLSDREREILEWVITGATNREIASKLFIAENTVKNHLKNILAKLHLQNRVQLTAFFKEQSRK